MKVRTSLSLFCALACLAVTAGLAAAAPSFYGYTGLVTIPNADALQDGDYNLAAFTINLEEGADSTVYAANLGIIDNLELGFARVRPEEAPGETFINAKYMFEAETEAHPQIAAGVIDFTNEVDTTVYVVLSKTFWKQYATARGDITSPQVHLGIGGGQLDGIFGGVSAVIADRLALMLEYDSEDINWGARLAVTDEVRVHFGAFDGLDDIGLGLSFNKHI